VVLEAILSWDRCSKVCLLQRAIAKLPHSVAKEAGMERWLGRYSEAAYALLRIVAGLLFACHGSQKLLGFPGAKNGTVQLGSFMGLAGVIELVGGLLIALGLFTGVAAFLASGQMAVAYFKAHAPDSFWPILNHGELAVLYCFLFLYIATRGGGRYAVDAAFRRQPRVAL
jgi:putative oxidoreductase